MATVNARLAGFAAAVDVDGQLAASIAALQQQIAANAAEDDILDSRITALEAGGPSAPSVSTEPGIDVMSPTATSLLTAQLGTVTGGVSPYTNQIQWRKTTIAGGTVDIPGETGTTLQLNSSFNGALISYVQIPVDSRGLAGAPRPSAVTNPVGGSQTPTISLSNLPTNPTTATSASITWALAPAGSGTVYCRRDGATPILAPNPFVINGGGNGLSVGFHTVDFYISVIGGGSDIDPAQPNTTYTWEILPAATITLSNLPSNGTTATSAQISYALSPAGAGVVFARRDGGAISTVPNPWNLTGLSVGSHTVDFYISANGTGSDVVLGSPAATYTWTIAASGGVTPLADMEYPAETAIAGYGGTWNGSTDVVVNISGSDVTLLSDVLDPNDSGVPVEIHRISAQGAIIYGGARCEVLWIDDARYDFEPGVDTWQAFAVQRKSDETFGAMNGWSYDELLVLQGHTPESGNTDPPYALSMGQWGSPPGNPHMRWNVAYNTRPPSDWNYNGGAYPDVEDGSVLHEEAMMPAGVWWRYVVHYRPGYESAHNPIYEVWRAKPGEAFVQLFSHTGYNAYNGGNGYPRKGIYKFSDEWAGKSTLAFYMTRLKFGIGTNLLEEAKASLIDFA